MGYRHNIIGNMNIGSPIYENTIPYQTESLSDGAVKYFRYENTTSAQFIRKQSTTENITTDEKVIGVWADRASLTYLPINP